jgi:hypothetical protein
MGLLTLQNQPALMIRIKLHANELPLRHLIIHLDGPTPNGFSGPLGKALNKVEERIIVAFKPMLIKSFF